MTTIPRSEYVAKYYEYKKMQEKLDTLIAIHLECPYELFFIEEINKLKALLKGDK